MEKTLLQEIPAALLPVSQEIIDKLEIPSEKIDTGGFLLIRSRKEARELAFSLKREFPEITSASASDIYGAACITAAWQLITYAFLSGESTGGKHWQDEFSGDNNIKNLPRSTDLLNFKETDGNRKNIFPATGNLNNDEINLLNLLLLMQNRRDPAFSGFSILFRTNSVNTETINRTEEILLKTDKKTPSGKPEGKTLIATLNSPVEAAPDSIKEQIEYILSKWGNYLTGLRAFLLGALDMIEEEKRPRFSGGAGPAAPPDFSELDGNPRYSMDNDWMPNVVLIAKNVLVWLDQLSKQYKRNISLLSDIPDEELKTLSSRGFNALWLIGLWRRSNASREIKRRMGNPEAAASAYSLFGYDIADELGGWNAFDNLRSRAESFGIRLSSDMVPNHVGIDSLWVREHPDYLLGTGNCPFPTYTFNSDNLSEDASIEIKIEDHYWDKSDAAVVFMRRDKSTGSVKYIYHGNDGTSMPWNDTAQIDFLNPEAREAVIQDILHVARNFPIIRFDAAMVLARKHIRRLWYPAPGSGGAIPSRSEFALSDEEFNRACPTEFWRDVVDRVAEEVPGTLLLAEAFWMMEGFFVRTLGMHRVYNSAFMNMIRDQKNAEYKKIIKETLAFDPGILQRFVNFMNNPDEETAVNQFGKDDRYFAACTLMATLPGLPMFGHGQIEGLSEKYGMEYIRAYKNEEPDYYLTERHEREIFPLLKQRHIFAGADFFRLFDMNGSENVFVYTNLSVFDSRRKSLVIVNNNFERASGFIKRSVPVNIGESRIITENIADILTEGDGVWLLMKEELSGLWYIRSIQELRNNGLNILIDGFGRQVFLNFITQKEEKDGVWGKLAGELNGSGTYDPWAAIAEIRLRPLKNTLNLLINKNFISELAEKLRKGKAPCGSVPAASWLYKSGISRLDRKDFENMLLKLSGLAAAINGSSRRSDPAVIMEIFRLRLKNAALYRRFPGFFPGSFTRTLNRLFGKSVYNEYLLLSAWLVVSMLLSADAGRSPEDTWNLWGLDLWLSDGRLKPGQKDTSIQPVDSYLNILKSAVSLIPEMEKEYSPDKIMNLMFQNPSFRISSGVNTWDDTLWFKKENWLGTVRFLLLSTYTGSFGFINRIKTRKRLLSMAKRWSKAYKSSGFKVEKLVDPES